MQAGKKTSKTALKHEDEQENREKETSEVAPWPSHTTLTHPIVPDTRTRGTCKRKTVFRLPSVCALVLAPWVGRGLDVLSFSFFLMLFFFCFFPLHTFSSHSSHTLPPLPPNTWFAHPSPISSPCCISISHCICTHPLFLYSSIETPLLSPF